MKKDLLEKKYRQKRTSRGETLLRLVRDVVIIAFSVYVAILLTQSGVIELITATISEGIRSLVGDLDVFVNIGYAVAALVAGMFFTSAFTLAPASVVLAELALHSNMWLVAGAGAVGALLGDLVLFFFIRDVFAADLDAALKRLGLVRHMTWLHGHFMQIVGPFVGALIIASPLPDELGLALMGFSKLKVRYLIPISLIMNFLGVLLIVFIAAAMR